MLCAAHASAQPVTLTLREHDVRDNRTDSAEVIRGLPSLVYPFEMSAQGEHFSGVLQVTVPGTISGVATPNPNGFTILLSPPLNVSASIRGQYTPATFPNPEDKGFYKLQIHIDALGSARCSQDGGFISVNQGKHDFSLSGQCTFNSLHMTCLGNGCNTGIYPVTQFTMSTAGAAGPWYSVFSPYIIAPPVALDSIEPSVVSNDPARPANEMVTVTIKGKDFAQGSALSLGEGIQVSNVNVKSATEIEAQISGFGGASEGPRNVEITRPDGTKQTRSDLFYVSSLAPEIEVNPGVPMKCTPEKPCIADHDTWVRVKLPCHGSGCESGKAAVTGVLHVKRDGSPISGSPFRPDPPVMSVRAAGTQFDQNTLKEAREALNFRFTGDKTLAEGSYEFTFETDARNLAASPIGSTPDRNKHLVRDFAAQTFRRSRIDRAIHISAIIDQSPRAALLRPIDPLGLGDFVRAAFPISKDLLKIDLSLNQDAYGPTVEETLVRLSRLAVFEEIQNRPATTYVVIFTTDGAIGSPGASACGTHAVRGFTCWGNAAAIWWEGDNSRASLAHELGHHQYLGDTYHNEPPGDEERSWNFACAHVSGCTVQTGNLDTILGTASVAVPESDPNYTSLSKRDVMGNAPRPERWIDNRTWEHLYAHFMARDTFNVNSLQIAADERRLVVRGAVKQDGSVALDPFVSYTGGDLREVIPGDYTVELRNAQGSVVSSRSFFVVFKAPHSSATLTAARFEVSLPYPDGAARVVITHEGREVASRVISQNAPTVTVISPNGGETLGATASIRWSAADVDGDSLTHTISYSPDGAKWMVLAADVAGTSLEWKTDGAAGTRKGRIRVITSDGVHTTSDTSDGDFSIAGKPPLVSLTSPADGGVYAAGAAILISGYAYDLEDGDLPASSLTYSSDRSGALGSGRSVSVSTLPLGAHTITMTARDKDGNTTTQNAHITVFTPGADLRVVPVVASTPGSGGSFFKTAVQIHNPTAAAIAGKLVYHPQGQIGTAADPSLPYMLLPQQTIAFEDLLPQLGQAGLGSVDLVATYGSPPVSVIRIFNDAGDKGTTGMTEELFRESDALKAGESGVLIAPIDPGTARYNIGIRTLGSGATMNITLISSLGALRTLKTQQYGPTHFVQVSAAALLGMAPAASDTLAFDIISGSALIYGASTDNLTQDPSLQIARTLAFYAGSGRRVLPVVGSAAGSLGSFFRTSVQLHNAAAATITGSLRFHPAGRSGTPSDPSMPYALAPGATFSTPDVLQAMGQAGLGSMDILPNGSSVPVSVVRIYNDAGAAGTTGLTEEQMTTADALGAGESGVLVAPPDPKKARFNLGIRTLDAGATLTITLRSATGEVRKVVTPVFAPNYFQQTTAAQLLGEAPLANETITVRVDAGNAIVYGAATDNKTQDPAIQVARRAIR